MSACLTFFLSFCIFSLLRFNSLLGTWGKPRQAIVFLQTRGWWSTWLGEGSLPGGPHRVLLSYIKTFIGLKDVIEYLPHLWETASGGWGPLWFISSSRKLKHLQEWCSLFDPPSPPLCHKIILLSLVTQPCPTLCLFVTPWTAARQASMSFTISRSSLKLVSIQSVMPSNISPAVVPFSSCPQSFPASGSFPNSQFFASGFQRIGSSASASVLPVNIQGWFPCHLWTINSSIVKVFFVLTRQWISKRGETLGLELLQVQCPKEACWAQSAVPGPCLVAEPLGRLGGGGVRKAQLPL